MARSSHRAKTAFRSSTAVRNAPGGAEKRDQEPLPWVVKLAMLVFIAAFVLSMSCGLIDWLNILSWGR